MAVKVQAQAIPGVVRGTRVAGQGRLAEQLGAAFNALLERLGDRPALISGDADTSLLARTGRNLSGEDLLLHRGRR